MNNVADKILLEYLTVEVNTLTLIGPFYSKVL